LLALLAAYAYAAIFPLSVVEGPIVTILAGYLVSLGYLDPVLAYVTVVAGDVTGDLAWYAAGRWGRRGIESRLGRLLSITPERMRRVDDHFSRHSGKTLLIGKFTQALGALVLLGAGATRMRPRRFLIFNLAATLPKSLGLLVFGYYFGKASAQAGSVLDLVALGTVMAIVLALLTWFLPRLFARRLQ
jgi:membrane-associated protein